MATDLKTFARQLIESGVVSQASVDSATSILFKSSTPDAEHLARLLVRQGELTAFQAQQIYGERALRVGKYVLLDKLGQGGMGLVYKARHLRMDRLVALKMLSPKAALKVTSLARFQREVEAAASLSHPNIVTAYDADKANGTYYLVLEYVHGVDLAVRVAQRGRFSVREAIDVIVGAARGLDYAHRNGVIHRDVKPSNLLRRRDGLVKVLDLGLARLESAASQDELTSSGQIMGTVDFMAPEQARNTREAGQSADIYSLGATFWFLVTGRPLFEGASTIQKLMAHQSRAVPSLAAAVPDASPALESAFRRMVAKKPADRFASMREVLAAFECLKENPSPLSRPWEPPDREGPPRHLGLSKTLAGGKAARATRMAASPSDDAVPPTRIAVKETYPVVSNCLDTDLAIDTLPVDSVRRGASSSRTLRGRRAARWRRILRWRIPRDAQAQQALAIFIAIVLCGLLWSTIWLLAD